VTETRVAFVNQPIDRILPPIQNSVGACTYGLGGALAERVDLTVYGRRDAQYGAVAERETHDGMHFRFRDAPRADRALFRYYDRFSPWLRSLNHGMNPPVSSSPALFPIYTRAAAREIGAAHYDVVHVQHSTQFVRPLKQRNPGGAVVLQLHAELYPQNNLRAIERRLRAANLVVTVSDYITELTRRQLPRLADRCHTLTNGIDPDEFTKTTDRHAGTGPLTVMFAGSVSPHKGVHLLIEAYASIAAAHPDSRLEIVGPLHTVPQSETYPMSDPAVVRQIAPLYDGDYVARLRAQIPRDLTDRITITGEVPRDELLARYARADVFVFPPIWDEGFGLPPVEAMAAGVPVVAARSGAVADTVVDGETGFLVDKGDIRGLAAAMSRLLADPDLRARMGGAGRRRALELFTWSRAADRAMDLYDLARSTARAETPIEE
jgi:glycosyltransferase involved in cell wall biosynthesis